jgi:RNA polymerase sigma-70 factor, ECF subfamily
MAEPMPSRRAKEALSQRVIFDAVWALVWKSLARLPPADRDDVAQEVAVRVWRYWGRYRSEKGTPEQWIRTIAKRTALTFLRSRGRFVLDEALVTMASDPRDPEERVMWSQLAEFADHVLEGLPKEERRAVILRELEGHTFREIAEMENISPATAHDRHARGMDKLKKAKDEGRLDALVPFAGSDDRPTQEMLDRAWQRFVDAGGLDLPPDSEPPPSGTRRRGPLTKLRKLGPLMVMFLGPGLAEPPGDPP